jgi:hypothetical protein
VTIGLTADRGGPVLGECWEFGELSGCRMAQQSVTIMVDMHDLGDSMADAVRPIGAHGQHGPWTRTTRRDSAPSRLGVGRHYGSSALHLPD